MRKNPVNVLKGTMFFQGKIRNVGFIEQSNSCFLEAEYCCCFHLFSWSHAKLSGWDYLSKSSRALLRQQKQQARMLPPFYVPAKTSLTTEQHQVFLCWLLDYKVSVSPAAASVQSLVPTNSKIQPNIYKKDSLSASPPPVSSCIIYQSKSKINESLLLKKPHCFRPSRVLPQN